QAACAAAGRVASAQGAEVAGCRVGGEVAEVTAVVRAGPFAPAVRARAGPPLGPVRVAPIRALRGRGRGGG
ncbi:hypothetical protein PL81_13805, partial [Streptomyces sp. RSD-27]